MAALNFQAPLDWQAAAGDELAMLNSLQANILKGHVRDALTIKFLTFATKQALKDFIVGIAPNVKSAKTHLEEVRIHKAGGVAGTVYVGVGLTSKAYSLLGIAPTKVPVDVAFREGAASRIPNLSDPALASWEKPLRSDIHAIVLVGDELPAPVTKKVKQLKPLFDLAKTVNTQTGKSQTNLAGDGLEHFGYVDGTSQPLFLTEDIVKAIAGNPAGWNPSAPLEQVITRDVAAGGVNCGSYFIYRKLEQNVSKFKKSEADLATSLGLVGADEERAGAMIVGRFEDGTPLTVSKTDGLGPKDNSFTYAADTKGAKCPFHAHIRKTNPRGSGGFESALDEKKHLMARRGQTYGNRSDDIRNASLPPSARPTKRVGLLFMAFNTNIANQFEFTQSTWANNPSFPSAPSAPGLDDVIGQGTRAKKSYPKQWDGTTFAQGSLIEQAVTMKGGEYFFFPSIAFLQSPQ
jgi:Dyp-type peroxidase family